MDPFANSIKAEAEQLLLGVASQVSVEHALIWSVFGYFLKEELMRDLAEVQMLQEFGIPLIC